MFSTQADPDLKYEVHDDQVNHQILDALNQIGVRLVNDSGANSLAMIHAVATETSGIAMHNAVAAQRQMQTLSAASVTATCAKLLGMAGVVPPPPKPTPPPPLPPLPLAPMSPVINPFAPLTPQSRTPTPPLPLSPIVSSQPVLTLLTISNTNFGFQPGTTQYNAIQVKDPTQPVVLSCAIFPTNIPVRVSQTFKDGTNATTTANGPINMALAPVPASVQLVVAPDTDSPQTYTILFA